MYPSAYSVDNKLCALCDSVVNPIFLEILNQISHDCLLSMYTLKFCIICGG
jgi:hypothetical protein